MKVVKVVNIGLGYIGLPTSVLIAQNEINVHGVDINQNLVATINQGKIYIVEPSIDVAIEEAVKKVFLRADVKPVKADIVVLLEARNQFKTLGLSNKRVLDFCGIKK